MADTTIYRLALIGFGSAGQGLAQILRDHGESLAQRYGVEMRIVAICTRTRGSLYDLDGLDPAALLEAITRDGHLRNLAGQRDWSPLDMIEQADADVLVELSPTDLTTGEPATSHMSPRWAVGCMRSPPTKAQSRCISPSCATWHPTRSCTSATRAR